MSPNVGQSLGYPTKPSHVDWLLWVTNIGQQVPIIAYRYIACYPKQKLSRPSSIYCSSALMKAATMSTLYQFDEMSSSYPDESSIHRYLHRLDITMSLLNRCFLTCCQILSYRPLCLRRGLRLRLCFLWHSPTPNHSYWTYRTFCGNLQLNDHFHCS